MEGGCHEAEAHFGRTDSFCLETGRGWDDGRRDLPQDGISEPIFYREEGLSIRTKTPKRKRAWRYRSGRPEIVAVNHCWAMDFMSDALFDGRTFRLLTVVDCHTRESLAIVPRTNFRAFQVVEVLERLTRERDKPKSIRCDNGPEFAGRMLDQ